jgi:hypothetical protein
MKKKFVLRTVNRQSGGCGGGCNVEARIPRADKKTLLSRVDRQRSGCAKVTLPLRDVLASNQVIPPCVVSSRPKQSGLGWRTFCSARGSPTQLAWANGYWLLATLISPSRRQNHFVTFDNNFITVETL